MNYSKKKQREAFLADIREVERKHGLRLAVVQPPPQMVIEEMPKEPEAASK